MIFTAYSALVYYGTFALFGAAGLLLHAFCLACAWLPATPGVERFFQRLISGHFAAFVWWMRFTGVCRVEYRGFPATPERGLVMVANHPGLMDAIYLLARVPEAVCLFKGSIRRNPVLGAARRAGYVANDGGLGLLRNASEKVAAGATLIVFPEGTRTPPGGPLGEFKPGFAAIARRANAPIQLVRIACDSNLLTKGRPWWKLPQLPARVVVQAGPRLDSALPVTTGALVADVEAWFRQTAPTRPSAPSSSPPHFAPSAHSLPVS